MGLMSSWLRGVAVVTAAVLLLCTSPARAATFAGLYSVTVAPDRAAPNQRAATLEAAMARLLIRVTGNRYAPLEPALQTLLRAPDDYLTSYGLDRQGRALVGFRGGQVERRLTELGMPVWGPERPLTLLWVAVDDGTGARALLGSDAAAEIGAGATPAMAALLETLRGEIAAAADERGLPIVLPLLDLEDLNAVTFADVWGGFDDHVLAASARYRADAVLIGRVRPGLFGQEVEWLFVDGVQRQSLPAAGVRDGLDVAADRYARDLATVGGASATSLTVLNVLTSADYGRVISYLEQQSVLETVDVESFASGTLTLRVAARGDTGVLERLLALGGVLRPATGPGAARSLTFELARNAFSP